MIPAVTKAISTFLQVPSELQMHQLGYKFVQVACLNCKVQGYFACFNDLIQFLLVEPIEALYFLNIRAPIPFDIPTRKGKEYDDQD